MHKKKDKGTLLSVLNGVLRFLNKLQVTTAVKGAAEVDRDKPYSMEGLNRLVEVQ